MPATTSTGNAILNCYLRGVAITPPSRVYVSLHTGNPGANGTANEVQTTVWPAYARQDPAGGGAVGSGFTAAANKATENSQLILFPANNGANPVTVTHFGIWTAATGGTCLLTGALSESKTINPCAEGVSRARDLAVAVD